MYDGSDRARPCKTELDVSLCFVPLLRWVLAWWCCGRPALAVEPTPKKDGTVSHRHQRALPGLRHSRGLPDAPGQPAGVLDGPDSGTAGGTGAGDSQGNDRGGAVRPGPGQSEIVETDTHLRLASLHEVCGTRHLLRRGRSKAASPRLRPTSGYRVDRERDRFSNAAAAKRRCTRLAVWYAEQEEPWIIPTGLPPDQVGVSWYALRFWIELGLKALKSLGWQWQKTRRNRPNSHLPAFAGAAGGGVAGPGLWRQGGRRL